MVKVEFGKKDSFWIALIVVLVGVGFVYSYGGADPAVMGHSEGELEGMATITYVDSQVSNLQTQIDSLGGGGGPGNDLVYGQHSSSQCTALGGTVVNDGAGNDFCRFNRASCSSVGWVQYRSWSATSQAWSSSCSYGDWHGGNVGECQSKTLAACRTGSHSWSDRAVESCSRTDGDSFYGCTVCTVSASANVNSVGCY